MIPTPPTLPRSLDPYEMYFDTVFTVVDRLGQGSFAEAFHVQSKLDGRSYAIKKTRQPFNGYKDRYETFYLYYYLKIQKCM